MMTGERGFSVGGVLTFGWRVAKANLGGFVPVLMIILLLAVAGQLVESFSKDLFPFNILISVTSMLLSLAVSLGVICLSLAFLDRGTAGVRDLIPAPALFPPYLVATFLYLLMVVGGIILGIIPGIIWGVRFSLYPFLIVDSRVGAMESLRGSARLTRGARWDLFSLSILEAIVNFLGLLCVGVGLFWTVPTGWMAKARAYRTLLAQSESEAPATAAPATIEPAGPEEDPPTAS
jgi:hypothetical protein